MIINTTYATLQLLAFSPTYSFKQFKKKWVCHTLALPFILKSITRQKKKNYGNSNISPCKNNIIFKKSSERNQNPSRYYNSIITNLKFQHKPKYIIFQKSSYKNRPIDRQSLSPFYIPQCFSSSPPPLYQDFS